jgi:hypothetical protein
MVDAIDWHALTNALEGADDAGANDDDILTMLQQHAPRLMTDIERDGRDDVVVGAWGRCSAIDENTHALIVRPRITRVLHRCFGVTSEPPHAGLLHTAGYLLSNAPTPYGLKRRRWLDGVIARGFGIADNVIAPLPEQGSLLSNLTTFLRELSQKTPDIAIEERCDAVTFTASLYRMPNLAETLLLVHRAHVAGADLLQTAFTVDEGFASGLVDEATRLSSVRARYNAVVDGMSGPQRGVATVLAMRPRSSRTPTH